MVCRGGRAGQLSLHSSQCSPALSNAAPSTLHPASKVCNSICASAKPLQSVLTNTVNCSPCYYQHSTLSTTNPPQPLPPAKHYHPLTVHRFFQPSPHHTKLIHTCHIVQPYNCLLYFTLPTVSSASQTVTTVNPRTGIRSCFQRRFTTITTTTTISTTITTKTTTTSNKYNNNHHNDDEYELFTKQ